MLAATCMGPSPPSYACTTTLVHASVTASLTSDSVCGSRSSASPSPPMAWRTTATFSARAGRVSSISAMCEAGIAHACCLKRRRGACRKSKAPRRTVGEVIASRRAGSPAHLRDAHGRGVPSRTKLAAPGGGAPKPPSRSAGRCSTLPAPPQAPLPAHRSTRMSPPNSPPQADGLYDPRFEHDACGVALVARLDNRPTHEVVDKAITALHTPERRGAAGSDKHTGDGAGMLMQMPVRFLRSVVD